MAMTARMRRLTHDYQQIERDFKNHKNIVVTPLGIEPYEKYHVTYYVNGIYLDDTGKVNVLNTHEVEIILHAEYPTYKPICKIFTPIWHPNFREGQICIGDIWGAGESLTDIIINIGDMIQYKSWNSSSPLSADAARWALENKSLFPVGNVNLNISEYVNGSADVDITLDGEKNDNQSTVEKTQNNENNIVSVMQQTQSLETNESLVAQQKYVNNTSIEKEQSQIGNDIDFSESDFVGVTYVPSAQRMQQMSQQIRSGQAGGGQINLKVVLEKGLAWGAIGAIVGFIFSELLGQNCESFVANVLGHPFLSQVYKLAPNYDFSSTVSSGLETAVSNALEYDFHNSLELMLDAMIQITRVGTGVWSALFASMVGLFMGIGEGVYYGSKENAKKYALIGFAISLVIGFISGDIAQLMYSKLQSSSSGELFRALIRGLGWSIMGAGVGTAIGLIKFDVKRFAFCLIGGGWGAFIGGFMFDFICKVFPSDVVSRLFGILVTGLLIGIGVGLLEQFAKAAWLKVTRGEFEGKEFLVFNGLTSVGSTGKNSIVLFKDKLVAPHHFDINLEGSKYVLIDCGSPMGTIVNGKRVDRVMLKNGDTISIGNTMLLFNTK